MTLNRIESCLRAILAADEAARKDREPFYLREACYQRLRNELRAARVVLRDVDEGRKQAKLVERRLRNG